MRNRPSSSLLLASLAIAALAVVCIFLNEAPRKGPPFPPAIRSEPGTAGPSSPTTDEQPSGLFVTDGGAVGTPPGIAIPMPDKPFKDQKRPKDGSCNDKRQVAINGGCWRELADKPAKEDGCGEDAYEKDGKCWAWIREAVKLPSSFELTPQK